MLNGEVLPGWVGEWVLDVWLGFGWMDGCHFSITTYWTSMKLFMDDDCQLLNDKDLLYINLT